MSNQRKDMNLDEAKAFVQERAEREAKKAIIAAGVWGLSKLPGAGKVESGFQKISNKIPDGFTVSVDPDEKKFSIGFKMNF